MSAEPMAAALGRIPSGLFVLTVQRGDIETGMLASWVQQCSFNPPLISLAINPKRDVAGLLTPDSLFTLNILEDTQTDMIVHFGRGFPLNEPAFTELEVIRGQSNGPILAESLAFLTCQVKSSHSAGDHDLFIAQVIDGRMLDEGHPMVHVRKSGSHY